MHLVRNPRLCRLAVPRPFLAGAPALAHRPPSQRPPCTQVSLASLRCCTATVFARGGPPLRNCHCVGVCCVALSHLACHIGRLSCPRQARCCRAQSTSVAESARRSAWPCSRIRGLTLPSSGRLPAGFAH